MRVLLALVIGICLGAAGLWFYNSNHGRSPMATAGDQLKSAAKSAGTAVEEKLHILDLRTNDIKGELAHTGDVIRRKAHETGQAIADATADARTTAAIKAKLLGDRDLSAISISVNTTAGIVTLAGGVPSSDARLKAIELAEGTDGVREVISTLQVQAKK